MKCKLVLSTATSSKKHNSLTAAAKRVSISSPIKQSSPQNTLLDHEYRLHRWAYSLKKIQAALLAAEALITFLGFTLIPTTEANTCGANIPARCSTTQAALFPTITQNITLRPSASYLLLESAARCNLRFQKLKANKHFLLWFHFQGQAGWSFKQPGVVGDVPVYGRGVGTRWS